MNLKEDNKSINKPVSLEDKICSEYRYKSFFQLSNENKVSIDEVRKILRQYSINKNILFTALFLFLMQDKLHSFGVVYNFS